MISYVGSEMHGKSEFHIGHVEKNINENSFSGCCLAFRPRVPAYSSGQFQPVNQSRSKIGFAAI